MEFDDDLDDQEEMMEMDEVGGREDDGVIHAIRFRNYIPIDKDLRRLHRRSGVPSSRTIVAQVMHESMVDEVGNGEENGIGNESVMKKLDWDLKRDVEKRLNKLARRTQRAIRELREQQQQG